MGDPKANPFRLYAHQGSIFKLRFELQTPALSGTKGGKVSGGQEDYRGELRETPKLQTLRGHPL